MNNLDKLLQKPPQEIVSQILNALVQAEWNERRQTALSLAQMGPEGLDILMQATENAKETELVQTGCFWADFVFFQLKSGQEVCSLRRIYEASDASIRKRTLERLIDAPILSESQPFLYLALGDESWDVRERACQGFLKLGREVVPFLEERFQHGNSHQRYWTFRILARLLGPEAIKSFSNFFKLDPKNEELQIFAVSNLGEIDEPRIVRTLLNFLRTESFFIHEEVHRSLKKLVRTQFEEMIQILEQEPDVRTAETLFRVLESALNDTILERAKTLLQSEHYPTRYMAISHLGTYPSQLCARLLLKCFEDPKWGLRRQAMEKLCQLGTYAIPALLEGLESKSGNQIFWSLKSLIQLREPSTLPAIASILRESPSKEHRMMALEAAAILQSEDSPEVLLEAFDNSMWEVRQKASELLPLQKFHPLVSLLSGAISDSNNIRFWSLRTLESIGAKGAESLLHQIQTQTDNNPWNCIRQLRLANQGVLKRELEKSHPILSQIELTIHDDKASAPASGGPQQIVIQQALGMESLYHVKLPEAEGLNAYPISVDEMFEQACNLSASDIHLKISHPPILRVQNKLITMRHPALSTGNLVLIVRQLLSQQLVRYLETNHQVDSSYESDKGRRLRLNIFKTRLGYEIAGRFITEKLPTFESLNLPVNIMQKLANMETGLVILTGPTGSGKTSTLAAMIHYINLLYHKHIICIEDPIEYIHNSKLSYISQREILRDVPSFPMGIRATLREDPDVILVGELRDQQSVETAMTLAGTGHLVLTTLHAPTSTTAVEQLMDFFAEEQQAHIRKQVAFNLRAIISQRLLRHKNGKERVPACEVLIATPAVKNIIRDGKTEQLQTMIETSKKEGMIALDQSLKNLLDMGRVTFEEAWPHVIDQKTFRGGN